MKYIAAISLIALGLVSAAPIPQSPPPLTFGLDKIGSYTPDLNGYSSLTDLEPGQAIGSVTDGPTGQQFTGIAALDTPLLGPNDPPGPAAGAGYTDPNGNQYVGALGTSAVVGLVNSNQFLFTPFQPGNTFTFA